jgi:hypothetical protein
MLQNMIVASADAALPRGDPRRFGLPLLQEADGHEEAARIADRRVGDASAPIAERARS